MKYLLSLCRPNDRKKVVGSQLFFVHVALCSGCTLFLHQNKPIREINAVKPTEVGNIYMKQA